MDAEQAFDIMATGSGAQKVGTITFSAPEVLKEEAYDFKADVWSLGIICYTLISSSLPYG